MGEKEEVNVSISGLKTKIAILEERSKFTDERITKHKRELTKRLEHITSILEKVEKILFEDGLVSTVKVNSDYIASQMKSRSGIVNFIYKTVITIGIGFIAIKVGLK